MPAVRTFRPLGHMCCNFSDQMGCIQASYLSVEADQCHVPTDMGMGGGEVKEGAEMEGKEENKGEEEKKGEVGNGQTALQLFIFSTMVPMTTQTFISSSISWNGTRA